MANALTFPISISASFHGSVVKGCCGRKENGRFKSNVPFGVFLLLLFFLSLVFVLSFFSLFLPFFPSFLPFFLLNEIPTTPYVTR